MCKPCLWSFREALKHVRKLYLGGGMTSTKKILSNRLFLYPFGVLVCLEIALLIMGYRPFRNNDYSLKATPGNAFIGDPLLGIQLNPGTYKISINDGVAFTARHLPNHTRYVAGRVQQHTDVLLLGCSFTYGFGVNDDQNFASILQKTYPEIGLQNDGVVGYGSVQSLMQLQRHLESDSLEVVLLDFSSYHLMRNSLSPQYRSNLKIGYNRSSRQVDNQMAEANFPYKNTCDGPIQFAAWNSMYTNWPGRDWLATINWMQTTRDKASEDLEKQMEITACIFKEMRDLCQQKGVKLAVVCLDSTPETEQLKRQLSGLPWLDVQFDFHSKAMTNLPFDSHPNEKGHQFIAQQISTFLGALLHED